MSASTVDSSRSAWHGRACNEATIINQLKLTASNAPRFHFRFQIGLCVAFVVAATAWICHCVQAINPVIDINGTFPYLLDNVTGRIIEPRDYMDFDNIYNPNETYSMRQTAQGRNYHMIKAFDFANYFQSDYWHYSSRDDLLRSAEPVANVDRCAAQLDWLERQLNRSGGASLFAPGKQHIQLMTLVDSFGHPETTTYFGHAYWLGSYLECRRVSIDARRYEVEECLDSTSASGGETLDQTKACQTQPEAATTPPSSSSSSSSDWEPIKFRYCIGKAHDSDWPTADNYVPRISYKVGLCLPEACETLTFERRPKQLERFMRFNLPEYTKQRIHLHEVYCHPDERSPIRRLPLSARVFLGLCSLWIVLLVAATVLYKCHRRHQKDLSDLFDEEQRLALMGAINVNRGSSGNEQERHTIAANGQQHGLAVATEQTQQVINDTQEAVRYSSLKASCELANSKLLMFNMLDKTQGVAQPINVRANPGSRWNISHQSGLSSLSFSAWVAGSPALIKVLQALSIEETLLEFKRAPRALELPDGAPKLAGRLGVNLNALDAIKCLCCILVIFGHIVFIHMQHLSNIAHTIELSFNVYPRTLIALFNFVDTFFIISGMLTAYFIFKRFNRKTFSNPVVWLYISLLRLLRLSPVYILVFWFIKTTSVYMTDGPIWDYGTDRKSIKGLCINDHWWKSLLYVGNWGTMQPLCILPAWSIIVDSQYSLVTPFIIYLIFRSKRVGYLLLLFATVISTVKMTHELANQTAVKTSDMAKIRLHVYPLISRFAAEFYNTAWNRIGPVAIGIFGGHMLHLYEIGAIRRWPKFMHGTGFKMVLLLHMLIFLLPVIGRFTDDPRSDSETDTTIFVLSNATIKPIWSIINTILLLRLITDLRSHSVIARLMSHNIWHCLGKLCFTSYLIHYEIILIMLKTREGLVDLNWSNAFREFSAVFLISTAISYVIYILYEAPMNKLIMLAFSKQSAKLKKSSLVAEISDSATTTAEASALEQGGLSAGAKADRPQPLIRCYPRSKDEKQPPDAAAERELEADRNDSKLTTTIHRDLKKPTRL